MWGRFSHLGQLLAEPEVLLAELAEGPRPLTPTVLLLGALLSQLGPQGLHIPFQLHSSGFPFGAPRCQAPAELMVLLLQPLWGPGQREVRLDRTQTQRGSGQV